MKYRTLGKTGKEISLLSYGCGRFPDDEQEAAALVSAAVDAGVNYFDTAAGYDNGKSERKIGLGVKARRQDAYVSTKSLVEPDTDGDAIRRDVEKSLKEIQTDYFDFYQFWGFRWSRWEQATKKGGALEAIRTLQDEGVIHHFGFTSHDSAENVLNLMRTGEFECATVQYNIVSVGMEEPIAYAHEHGIGMTVMCPAAGGLLANPTPQVRELFPGATHSSASAELALRFVWSNPGVTAALSGMERASDLESNVRTACEFEPLSEAERQRPLDVISEFAALGTKFCTGCSYCLPCPNKIWIRDIFRLYNYARLYDLTERARAQYQGWPADADAGACTECGECEAKCPHGIPIIAQLKEVVELFGEKQPKPPSQ